MYICQIIVPTKRAGLYFFLIFLKYVKHSVRYKGRLGENARGA